MPAVLHLVDGAATPLALDTIHKQTAAGDRITVVLLEGAPAGDFPHQARIHRLPGDVSYDDLLDLVFAADQVIAW